MLRSYSDHHEGAHMFLVKVTGFFVKNLKVNVVMRQHNIWFHGCHPVVWHNKSIYRYLRQYTTIIV